MVKLNKIYTKTGDKGTTALVTGERRPKHDLRISAYGTVDEVNSAIGLCRLHTTGTLDEMLGRVQNDCFDLGADLATPHDDAMKFEPLRATEAQVTRLESEIDELNAELNSLESFILPGGNEAAAFLHMARTTARRAERLVTELMDTEPEAVSPPALKYLNRLSDFLFVAARYANNKGKGDILWVPGANR